MLRITATYLEGVIVMLALILAMTILGARLFHITFLSIQSNSMLPVFRAGDLVLVDTDKRAPTIGSTVAYRSLIQDNTTITHRVIAVNASAHTIRTQGDNLTQADPTVPQQRIMGSVGLVIERGGKLIQLIRQPMGLIVVLVVPLCIICVAEVLHVAEQLSSGRYRLLSR